MVRVGCVVGLLTLFACEVQVAPTGTCGGEVCEAAQRCDEGVQRCVPDEAPVLSLSGPTGVVTTARFTVRGTARDDVAVKQLEWSLDEGAWQAVSAQADGRFELDVEAPSADAKPVQVKVRAGDGKQVVLQSLTVTVDRVAPQVTLKSPLAGAVQTSARVPLVLTVTDGSGALASLSVAGKPVSSPGLGDTRVEVDLVGGDLEERLIAYEVLDVYGNRAADTVRVQIDDTAPTPVFLSPTAQPAVTNAATLRVQVQATDRSSLARVLVTQLDGGQVEAVQVDAGVWGADFPLPATEATVRFSAETIDALGNRASAVSAEQPFDRLAPQLSLLGPDAGTPVNAAFLVRAQSNADAVSVQAQFGAATVSLTEGANDAWQGTVPLMLTGDAVSTPLVLTARDAVGNVTTVTSSVLVDTVAPRITFTTPAAGAKLNATSFTGGNDVQVQWTVQDGDPTAGTRTVNGQASSANQLSVTTSTTDNGRGYTVTVVARDQLNERTASLDFTVDRVVPTLLSWTPSPNARHVDPRETRVTFSEPVFGATAASPALVVTPSTSGAWDTEHRSWAATGLTPYSVFSAALVALTDAAGNPVAGASTRSFHTAAAVPASGTVVATGVASFKAVADSEGVVTVATTGAFGLQVRALSPVTGALETPLLTFPGITTYELSAWAVLDGATLTASNRRAVTYTQSTNLERRFLTGFSPTPSVAALSSSTGTVLTMPPIYGEQLTRAYGLITGASYDRGGTPMPLATAPTVAAQAFGDWVGLSSTGSVVEWSRFTCYQLGPVTAPHQCEAFRFGVAASSATNLRATLSPSGGCFVGQWTSGGARQGVFQSIESCTLRRLTDTTPPSCISNTAVSAQTFSNELRVAPFSANGESTLIASYVDGGYRVGKLTNPAVCAPNFTPIGAPLSDTVTAAEPIQVGNKAALLYIDGASNLKLYVP